MVTEVRQTLDHSICLQLDRPRRKVLRMESSEQFQSMIRSIVMSVPYHFSPQCGHPPQPTPYRSWTFYGRLLQHCPQCNYASSDGTGRQVVQKMERSLIVALYR